MLLNQKNTRKQGDVGVGYAIAWFISNGYTVSIPLTDSQDYDLIVEIEGSLKKVQVKTTRQRASSGNYKVNLRTSGGNRSGIGKVKYMINTDVDYLFVLTGRGDRYLIPKTECQKSFMVLGEIYKDFKL